MRRPFGSLVISRSRLCSFLFGILSLIQRYLIIVIVSYNLGATAKLMETDEQGVRLQLQTLGPRMEKIVWKLDCMTPWATNNWRKPRGDNRCTSQESGDQSLFTTCPLRWKVGTPDAYGEFDMLFYIMQHHICIRRRISFIPCSQVRRSATRTRWNMRHWTVGGRIRSELDVE